MPYLHDSLDQALITALRKNARASISHLAEQLNVSRGTVQNRLDRLVSSGVILGFTIRTHDSLKTNSIRAIMSVQLTGKSTSSY